jgi:hypothetical protein
LRRITKAALGGIAGCALVLGGTQVATGATLATTYRFSGPLTDLQPGTDSPFEPAEASLKITQEEDGTTFFLRVKGIEPTALGKQFGSHLHTGKCSNPDTTEGHYNIDGPLGEVVAEKEVWFALVPNEDGVAVDKTQAGFVPTDLEGEMSVVIHADEMDPVTNKYPKQVCLPLEVPFWLTLLASS